MSQLLCSYLSLSEQTFLYDTLTDEARKRLPDSLRFLPWEHCLCLFFKAFVLEAGINYVTILGTFSLLNEINFTCFYRSFANVICISPKIGNLGYK